MITGSRAALHPDSDLPVNLAVIANACALTTVAAITAINRFITCSTTHQRIDWCPAG
jgi:hypothetical protein